MSSLVWPWPFFWARPTLYEFWIKELDFSSVLRFSFLHSTQCLKIQQKKSRLDFNSKNNSYFCICLLNKWDSLRSQNMWDIWDIFMVFFKHFVNVGTNLRGDIFLILNHYSITFDKRREYIPLPQKRALLRFFWAENPISYKNANSLEENSRHTNWNNCGYKNGSNMGKQ